MYGLFRIDHQLLLEFDRSGTFSDYSLSIYKCITDKQVDVAYVIFLLLVFLCLAEFICFHSPRYHFVVVSTVFIS